ncbi:MULTISPECIES: sensor domain-containing diguanylate cyclase [Psychrobacter]|uniref:GGDEF domain-containing protein n=1 Tax=Psychrobacter TaxID=497 RepID=UPI000ECD43E8|nr:MULTISPECIES: GGDEF domain-containing protein [Psychrobacter]MBE8609016.1 GGDEF domain-containing protein [Pseudomonas lundensis]HCI77242.1 GGDEF domain-containing protein [Psychrobacter sp.]
MAVSISHLGYTKLSQAIFEWQAADKTSLLALFMVMEVSLHWLWCLFVWWRRDVYDTYVDIALLYPLWFGVTLVALFLLWMTSRFSPVKKANSNLYKWQGILITVYSAYIAMVILVLGHSSLVAGVSLVGGAILGMMLIRRRYVWRAFLGHAAVILAVTFIPYLGVTLPNLRQMTLTVIPLDTYYSYINYSEITTIENAISASIFQNGTLNWDSVDQLRRSSAFFWRSTHIYMALPKAIFIIYMFRTLLLILDDSKKEILQHANQDELTQLKSRRYGMMQMKQVLKSVEDHQDISVILLDLDWFKEVNDSYGHEIGDRVLVEVAQTLLQSLTDETIVSRYGGEEFLIVLPDTKHDTAMIIAEQLRRVIAKHVIILDDDTAFSVTASLGLYTLTHGERNCIKQACETLNKKDASQSLAKPQRIPSYSSKRVNRKIPAVQLPHDICQRLICMADKALYEAKGRGRDQVVSANEMLAAKNNNIEALYGT